MERPFSQRRLRIPDEEPGGVEFTASSGEPLEIEELLARSRKLIFGLDKLWPGGSPREIGELVELVEYLMFVG